MNALDPVNSHGCGGGCSCSGSADTAEPELPLMEAPFEARPDDWTPPHVNGVALCDEHEVLDVSEHTVGWPASMRG